MKRILLLSAMAGGLIFATSADANAQSCRARGSGFGVSLNVNSGWGRQASINYNRGYSPSFNNFNRGYGGFNQPVYNNVNFRSTPAFNPYSVRSPGLRDGGFNRGFSNYGYGGSRVNLGGYGVRRPGCGF